MNTLRSRLREITENPNIGAHRVLVESLRATTRHTIQVLDPTPTAHGYNCVMYALAIVDDEDYVDLAMQCPKSVHADTDFLRFLIEKGYLDSRERPRDRRLIVYYDAARVKHVGIVRSKQRIRSKWGIGLLYEHAPLEVPAEYGDALAFFEPTHTESVINHFIEYAATKGIQLR